MPDAEADFHPGGQGGQGEKTVRQHPAPAAQGGQEAVHHPQAHPRQPGGGEALGALGRCHPKSQPFHRLAGRGS